MDYPGDCKMPSHTSLQEGGRRSFDRDSRGKGTVTVEGRDGMMGPQARDCSRHQHLGEAREGFSPRTSGRSVALLMP